MLWYSLEVPHCGTSNEYPQYMFTWRNTKNILSGYILKSKAVLRIFHNNTKKKKKKREGRGNKINDH